MFGDTKREANSGEVKDLRKENDHRKRLVAEFAVRNDILKKSSAGLERL